MYSIIFLTVSLGAFGYIWRCLRSSPAYIVKEVVSKDASVDVSYLKGRNIFAIDLDRESQALLSAHPDYKRVKLIRILPDRLYVDFIERKPLALIKLYRDFTVDEDGTLFSVPEAGLESEVPLISGLEAKLHGPRPGKKYNIRELDLALEIIREFSNLKAFRGYRISRLNLQGAGGASFFVQVPIRMDGLKGPGQPSMSSQLEVKISYGNIKQKILILAGVIAQSKNDLSGIRYVDLRFKDPVIKLK